MSATVFQFPRALTETEMVDRMANALIGLVLQDACRMARAEIFAQVGVNAHAAAALDKRATVEFFQRLESLMARA